MRRSKGSRAAPGNHKCRGTAGGQLLDEAGDDDGVAPDDLAKKGARRTAA
jgi:hypothetical protein